MAYYVLICVKQCSCGKILPHFYCILRELPGHVLFLFFREAFFSAQIYDTV